jgi:hypothetical protein
MEHTIVLADDVMTSATTADPPAGSDGRRMAICTNARAGYQREGRRTGARSRPRLVGTCMGPVASFKAAAIRFQAVTREEAGRRLRSEPSLYRPVMAAESICAPGTPGGPGDGARGGPDEPRHRPRADCAL